MPEMHLLNPLYDSLCFLNQIINRSASVHTHLRGREIADIRGCGQNVRFVPSTEVGDERLGTRPRLLGCLFDIPRHFQASQQLDIARGAVDAGFTDARGFVSCTGLNP